jgi:hypothetical protein
MVCAVAITIVRNFERALGGPAMWALRRSKIGTLAAKLKRGKKLTRKEEESFWVPRRRIYPHASLCEANAYYSPEKRVLLFSYFPASAGGDVYPLGMVFSCSSHDIVAHETTHALLDRMHWRFIEASHLDVLAFHEELQTLSRSLSILLFPNCCALPLDNLATPLQMRKLRRN